LDQNQFLSVAAEICEVDVIDLTLGSNLDDIDWDSLANISFIAEVDSTLGKSVSPEKLNKCETLADVYALISE
jgi:acyl carrier protein